jgi:16S rRNA C967 or C1407 C5-methylase (RsmB/RsmF family)
MKSVSLILLTCIIFSLNSCGQNFKKLADPEIDKSKVKIAQDFASDFLTKLKSGEEYQFQDKAVDAIKNQFTAEVQKTVYQQLKTQFGEYKSLEYCETWVQNNSKSINIYRFKGEFEKNTKKLEIRIVLNESNKIAGFWIKPWSDMLN